MPAGYWIIWTTVALDLVGFGIVVPILGRYAERFGANGLQVGLMFASFSVAQMVFAPILGRISDKVGRKPVIVFSLIGTAVGSFVTGAAGALWVLFLGRILDGASGASVAVAQGAVADIAPPDQRARLMGLLGAAFGVGFAMTTTSVVTVPLHPPPLTLSVYIPPFATVAIGIVGFCALEVKPFGPVQAYIDPGVAKPFN